MIYNMLCWRLFKQLLSVILSSHTNAIMGHALLVDCFVMKNTHAAISAN